MTSRTNLVLFALVAIGTASAQWQMQDSHTTASLRGIHSVNGAIAWASGTGGTVLRTEDGGYLWQKCAIPPGAEKLDFRGIWAWDAQTAIAMSAGPGEASRLYKTVDGCLHWTEELKNSEKDGFWDVIAFSNKDAGVLVGDPIAGHFDTYVTGPKGWVRDNTACVARDGEAAFAASNSSVFAFGSGRYVVGTGGKGGPHILLSPSAHGKSAKDCLAVEVPLASGNESSGVFSVSFRDRKHGLAVGGDYKKPSEASGTAAWTSDGGLHWTAATKPPHGYRSSVAWDPKGKVWIAAGTNGSDISRDDGKTWQPIDDGDWNALSPPYVVGPKGRIGKIKTGKP